MTKIVIINPPLDSNSEGTYERWAPSMPLGYLGTALLDKGYDVEVIDAKYDSVSLQEIGEIVKKKRPRIIGITVMTEDFRSASITAKKVKSIDHNIVVVVGGPHPTALPTMALDDCEHFDISVAGEGEHVLPIIVDSVKSGNYEEIKKIPGVSIRLKNGSIFSNSDPPTIINDLDKIPFPRWHKLLNVSNSTLFPIVTSRGCPYKCVFCQPVYGRVSQGRRTESTRFRSVSNILSEVEYLVSEVSCKRIAFCDDTFTLNRKRVLEFLDIFVKKGYHNKVKWWGDTRVNLVDLEILKKMKAAGCEMVSFGIESGNDEILKKIGKGITKDQARKAVKWAREADLKIRTFFILGHPYETRQTAQDTLNFASELNADGVTFSIMTPLPGTVLEDWAKNGIGGLRFISTNWSDYSLQLSDVCELDQLPISDIKYLQMRGYLRFYIRPSRLLNLLKIINKKKIPFITLHLLKVLIKSFLPKSK